MFLPDKTKIAALPTAKTDGGDEGIVSLRFTPLQNSPMANRHTSVCLFAAGRTLSSGSNLHHYHDKKMPPQGDLFLSWRRRRDYLGTLCLRCNRNDFGALTLPKSTCCRNQQLSLRDLIPNSSSTTKIKRQKWRLIFVAETKGIMPTSHKKPVFWAFLPLVKTL